MEDNILLCGYFNGHISMDNVGFESMYGGYGFGQRNEEETSIYDFALTYNLYISNTYF